MSGIAGSKTNGAFLIVASGIYEHLDADRGDSLHLAYRSHALLVPDETVDPRMKIVSTSRSQYSPSKGLRYDGLYLIAGEEPRTNTHGGAYTRFHLQRNGNHAGHGPVVANCAGEATLREGQGGIRNGAMENGAWEGSNGSSRQAKESGSNGGLGEQGKGI